MFSFNKKLYLSPNWKLRYEPALEQKYRLFDIYSALRFNINASIYKLFKFLETGATIEDVSQHFNIHSIQVENFLSECEQYWPNIVTSEDNSDYRNVRKVGIDILNAKVPVYSFPISAEIHLTEKCNLKCRHCIYACGGSIQCEVLSAEDWYSLFRELENYDFWNIVLTGGEIFMYPDIDKLLATLKEMRIHFDILTNAMLINKHRAEMLSSPNISVSVSLDGSDSSKHDFLRGKGAFDVLIRKIRLLIENNVKVNLSVTLNQKNYDDIDGIVRLAKENKCKGISFIVLDNHGRAENDKELQLSEVMLQTAIESIKRNKEEQKDLNIALLDPSSGIGAKAISDREDIPIYCTGGTSHIAITSSGDVFPCVYAFDMPEFKIDNIKNDSILNIWNSEKWQIMRGSVCLNEISSCSQCEMRHFCTLRNCRVRAKLYSGDFYGKPSCNKRRITINDVPLGSVDKL